MSAVPSPALLKRTKIKAPPIPILWPGMDIETPPLSEVSRCTLFFSQKPAIIIIMLPGSSPVYVSYEHKINEKEKEYPIIYGNRLSNPSNPKRERHRRAKLPATALSARKKIWILLIMFRPACKRTRKGKAVEFSHTQTLAGALTALNTKKQNTSISIYLNHLTHSIYRSNRYLYIVKLSFSTDPLKSRPELHV